MESKGGLPRLRCIYEWYEFEVKRHAAATLEGDSHRKSYRKLICRIVNGLAVGARHQREDEADMPAHSYALLRLRQWHSERQGRPQHCQCNPCFSHLSSPFPFLIYFLLFLFNPLGNAKSPSRSVTRYYWSASRRAWSESNVIFCICPRPVWRQTATLAAESPKDDLFMRIAVLAGSGSRSFWLLRSIP
jgi:hypothetical protein